MTLHTPALLIIVPLIAACLIAVLGSLEKRLCFPLALIGLGAAGWAGLDLAWRAAAEGRVGYHLGGWPPPFGIAYEVDRLNAPVLAVISLVAILNLIASRRPIETEQRSKKHVFYALYVLATAGLLGMTVTGDAFNLYVLLEIASLSGYALTALGDERAPLSALNYVFLGTVGASFYLLGVGFLYMVAGSLNMLDLAGLLPGLSGSRVVLAAFILVTVGLWLKSAFFPLHGWLPNAYTHANSAAAGLMAPLMTKVMIYVMIRMMLTVFGPDFVFKTLHFSKPVVFLAAAAILAGGLLALSTRNLKRMLTYIIVAEVGYMMGGAWLGNRDGLTGAVLHLLNDALMTSCVFLAAGNIGFMKKDYSFDRLEGLFGRMPFTMAGLVVGALSIIGAPPACGFFSKWYLLKGALAAGRFEFFGALILSSLINLALFFRVFEKAFFTSGPAGGGHDQWRPGMNEVAADMVAPLLIMAAGLIAAGLFTGKIVEVFISRVIPPGF